MGPKMTPETISRVNAKAPILQDLSIMHKMAVSGKNPIPSSGEGLLSHHIAAGGPRPLSLCRSETKRSLQSSMNTEGIGSYKFSEYFLHLIYNDLCLLWGLRFLINFKHIF